MKGNPIQAEQEQELSTEQRQIAWLRGVLRLIAERIREPSPDLPTDECYRATRDLARAALRHSGLGELNAGDLRIDPEEYEESMAAYERGDYQTAEEILRELSGKGV
jgi:hypothetical protein